MHQLKYEDCPSKDHSLKELSNVSGLSLVLDFHCPLDVASSGNRGCKLQKIEKTVSQ